MRAALLCLSLLLPLQGCATIVTVATRMGDGDVRRSPAWKGVLLWSGTRADLLTLTAPFLLFGGVTRVLAAIDLPLSLLLDTALSPVTLVQSLTVWCGDRASSDPDPPAPDPPPPPRPASDPAGGRPWRERRARPFDAPREYGLRDLR